MEAALPKQRPCFKVGERHRIPIERNAPHDHTRSRIPRIVLKQGEVAAGRQRIENRAHRGGTFREGNVMKNAIHVTQVERRFVLKGLEYPEADVETSVASLR